MELADETRRAVEALKTFDVVHELRMLTEQCRMGCPGAENTEELLAEKLKAFHDGLVCGIEKLLEMNAHNESRLDTLFGEVRSLAGQVHSLTESLEYEELTCH